ncbi:MAG: hypothetical protein Nkreftii_002661 [Candidatus Nitrospira kreftii]|uniref:Lipoprotein n=1 Tax=Candidatus Nitrospira kreftii TaxID=2652173 RepID=A0A7S8FFE6_9BACT|nr:MAG: hypothetical protein Nkreftii_002661 [Candidatus Nitrospira kreftii]
MSQRSERIISRSVWLLPLLCVATLSGCVVKQSEIKEHKQYILTLSRAIDQQDKKISILREQELPQVRGQLEQVQHQAHELHVRQEEIKLILSRFEKLHEAEKIAISQRLDSLDVVIGKILLRLEAIEKRLKDKP